MTTLTFPSQAPVSVTKGSVTQVYDHWKVVSVQVFVAPGASGAVKLSVTFRLCGTASDGTLVDLLGQDVNYVVPDILSDSALTPSASAFFTALVTEAFSRGSLS